MRIPHIINKNTIEAYRPSTQTEQLEGEDARRLIAEDFEWDKEHCPTLEDFCVQALAAHFHENPLLTQLPCADLIYLLDILPLDLPLELIIPIIDEEHYWERRYKEAFKYMWRPQPPGWTWKSQYLERHCQQLMEQAQPQYRDEETMDEILSLCNPYVSRLFIEQLQAWKPPLTMEKEDVPEVWPIDHINLLPIFRKLTNIQELDIVFGMKNVGESFSLDMFKLSTADCQKLGRAIQELPNIQTLRIHRSNLHFEHCQALVQGLIKCPTLQELDLSHCLIGDPGALCVAFLLQQPGISLKALHLTNNGIGKVGAEGLGFALLHYPRLEELNLRLNPLATEGAMGILRALVRCSAPQSLSMAACMFEEDTSLKVAQMIKLNDTLKRLDVSSNYFGEAVGQVLVEAVESNTAIEWLDLRETDVSAEQKQKINESLVRNRSRALRKKEQAEDQVEEAEQFNFKFEQ